LKARFVNIRLDLVFASSVATQSAWKSFKKRRLRKGNDSGAYLASLITTINELQKGRAYEKRDLFA
jgi:hypothetical protein